MAIGSRTSISNTQLVLPKHDVEPAGSAGHPKQDGGKREQTKQREKRSESHPTTNQQGQMTGVFIDVSV